VYDTNIHKNDRSLFILLATQGSRSSGTAQEPRRFLQVEVGLLQEEMWLQRCLGSQDNNSFFTSSSGERCRQ
jgi:hypothetical protein